MSGSATRLRQAREKAGYPSAAAAARKFDWNPATYRHHENGTRGFGGDHAEVYGKAFSVNPAWLAGLSLDMRLTSLQALDFVMTKFDGFTGDYADLEAKLGEILGYRLVRKTKFDDILKYGDIALYTADYDAIPLSLEVVRRIASASGDDLVAVEATNDDMSPTIKKGAHVVVDVARRELAEHDRIWLFSFAGLTAIRRLRSSGAGSIVGLADASTVPAITLDMNDPSFAIHGAVVWVANEIG